MSMVETEEVAADTACGGMSRRVQHSLTIAFMAGESAQGIRFRT